ncbi:lipopolysaccharide biosynthesis protein [Rhizobium esperanzae]|uniref:O-antigen/teichoic acid export membrane protein n=1 Tax=Rhizobium esperanzae TaxID=1967781 RepID=A0A7W6R3E4_9HYPH|nr:lipopolysaccharide biosynthesis protein [Rhizobium esperanzae]MBB4235971.1 O-antigen/teichoic acid export membrane protein [Rhizobium esperanzae]
MNFESSSSEGIRPHALKKKTLYSTFWNFIRLGYVNFAQFVFFVILARMLEPAQFGTFSVAAVMYQIVRMIAGAGLGEAIVRAPTVDSELLDTVFWGALAFSTIGAAALAALSIPYSMIIRAPEVVPLLQALSGVMIVGSLSVVHLSIKTREFGHKALALRTVITTTIGGVSGVAAAFEGMGTWSLFIQIAVAELLGLFFWWTSVAWRPTFKVSLTRLWPIFSFGMGVTATQISWLLLVRVQDVVVSRFLGLAAAASYRVSWRLIDVIVQTTFGPIGGVTSVTLSRLQNDKVAFRRAYLRLQGLASFLTMPAIAGFAALGPEIITLTFGHKWAYAGPAAQILGWLAIPFCLNFLVGPALQALGASVAMSRLALLQLALTTVFSVVGAQFGLEYVALAYVIRAYLTLPLQLRLLQKFSGIEPLAVMKELSYPIICSGIMVVVLLVGKKYLDPNPIEVVLLIFTGALVYFLSIFAIGRRWLIENVNSLKGAIRHDSQ